MEKPDAVEAFGAVRLPRSSRTEAARASLKNHEFRTHRRKGEEERSARGAGGGPRGADERGEDGGEGRTGQRERTREMWEREGKNQGLT